MHLHHFILAIFCLACLWAYCVLTRRTDPDDRASGTQIGQLSHEEDAFHHQPNGHSPELTRVVCMTCGRVRCADKQWRPAREVCRPEDYGLTVQTSHGYCPRCADAAHAELDAALPVGSVAVPATQEINQRA